jgi:hypothetical protein
MRCRRSRQGPARALIETQIAAYDHLLNFATGSTPVAEAWFGALHAELVCTVPSNIADRRG